MKIETITAPSMELLIKNVDSTINYQASNSRFTIKNYPIVSYDPGSQEYSLIVTFGEPLNDSVRGDQLVVITGNSMRLLNRARKSIVEYRCNTWNMKDAVVGEVHKPNHDGPYVQCFILKPND